MDCRSALTKLDIVPPDGLGSAAPPELAPALEHLHGCPRCQEVFGARQEWDAKVSAALRDVEIPQYLEQRLLQAVTAAEPRQPPPAASRTPIARRLWFQIGVTVAATFLMALLGWQFGPARVRVDESQLAALAKIDFESLDAFEAAGGFAPRLPSLGWNSAARRLRLDAQNPRGLSLAGGDKHDAALYPLWVPVRGRAPVEGMLLVVPRSKFASPPTATSLSLETVRYAAGCAWTSWSDGPRVYVCYVRGDASHLDELLRLLNRSSPLT